MTHLRCVFADVVPSLIQRDVNCPDVSSLSTRDVVVTVAGAAADVDDDDDTFVTSRAQKVNIYTAAYRRQR